MSQTCVCVFAKPPISGRVKTRLAKTIGDGPSSELAQAFLRDVWSLTGRLDDARVVLATTDTSSTADGLGRIERWAQGEGDLGAKLQRVLERGLHEHSRVVALGGDSPDLPMAVLHEGVASLEEWDAALCPAKDGGFVMLTLRRLPPGLLHNLPWSSSETCAALVQRLQERGLSLRMLPGWSDIDDASDLQELVARLRNSNAANYTRKVLESHGRL